MDDYIAAIIVNGDEEEFILRVPETYGNLDLKKGTVKVVGSREPAKEGSEIAENDIIVALEFLPYPAQD